MTESAIVWRSCAKARLKKVPFFIRPFVKSRVEKVARARNFTEINEGLLIEIKRKEMPG